MAHSSVVYNDKIWVIGGSDDTGYKNDVWYSSDGTHWTSAALSAPWSTRAGHTSVVFDGKIWVIGGNHYQQADFPLSDVWYSSDGVTWTSATLAVPWLPRFGHTSVACDGKMWVIGGHSLAGSDVWYSSDGVYWTSATLAAPWPARYDHSSAVYGERIWIVGGRGGTMSDYKNDAWYSAMPTQHVPSWRLYP